MMIILVRNSSNIGWRNCSNKVNEERLYRNTRNPNSSIYFRRLWQAGELNVFSDTRNVSWRYAGILYDDDGPGHISE